MYVLSRPIIAKHVRNMTKLLPKEAEGLLKLGISAEVSWKDCTGTRYLDEHPATIGTMDYNRKHWNSIPHSYRLRTLRWTILPADYGFFAA